MAMTPRLMQSPASRQQLLASSLTNQAMQPRNIQSPMQGYAQLAQALFGGLNQRKADQMLKTEQTDNAAKLASMLSGAGVDPNIAPLFGSSVPNAPQLGAALMENQAARDLAQVTAKQKLTTATIVSGGSPEGKGLGIPEGKSFEVTRDSAGRVTGIGKPFDSQPANFPGTGATSGAMNAVTGGATSGKTDTAAYAAAYAYLSRSRSITLPDGRKIAEQPMDLSNFPAPTFGPQTQPPASRPSPPAPETPTSEAPQESAEPSPESVPETDTTVAADKQFVTIRLPQFRDEQAKALTNLGKLEKVINLLGERDDLTGFGPAVGVKLGELFGLPGVIAPSASDTKNRIESVAQESIRQLMGAQFAEKEGENVLRRAFDVSQPEAVNMQRIRELYGNLQTVLNSKRDEAQYFEKHGTLRGYVGPSLQELEALLTGGGAGDQPIEPLKRGQTTKIGDVTVERVN